MCERLPAATVDFAAGSRSHDKSIHWELICSRCADCIFLCALGELGGEIYATIIMNAYPYDHMPSASAQSVIL